MEKLKIPEPKTGEPEEKTCERCGAKYKLYCIDCAIKDRESSKNGSDQFVEAKKEAVYLDAVKNAIPPRFEGCTFKNYRTKPGKMEETLNIVKKYACDNTLHTGRALIMAGNVGNGKSHLGFSILKNRLWHGQSVKYTTAYDLISNIRDCKTNFNRSEIEEKKTYCDVDWLMLDEVGKQSGTETEYNIIFSILNERYNKRKPTILISNKPLEEFRRFVGDTIMDRFQEDNGLVINFNWESFRGNTHE